MPSLLPISLETTMTSIGTAIWIPVLYPVPDAAATATRPEGDQIGGSHLKIWLTGVAKKASM